MATLYCDFENGNDDYAGSSFALLASGTNGRITSTTFSSATASFPNDGSLIGQYLSIFNGTIYAVYNITAWVSSTSLTIAALSGGTALANQAVDRQYYIGGRWKSLTNGATAVRTILGDTIRIMASPEPTSLGQNGVWTSQGLQATKNISSSTNATPIAITCTAHGYSTGDTVVITGHNTNTNANGTWEITSTGANTFTLNGSVGNGTGSTTGTVRLRNNTRVMLTTAVTQNIASTGPNRVAWTSADAVNVTTGFNTTDGQFQEHNRSDTVSVLASFTTGRAAYWATPSTLDLSGYQQVSFFIRQNSGTIGAAGAVDLRLCSDNAGVTAVHTISIPNLAVTSRWVPLTIDFGTNLSNNINSVAFYVNTDNGAQVFQLSNIIACKASSAADSLTLTSLIGKNTTGEAWWAIQSINGTRVMLSQADHPSPSSADVRGYFGVSGTVTTWKRETIKQPMFSSDQTINQTVNDSGITVSGGWDRTNMSSQTDLTFLDGQNGYSRLISSNFDNNVINGIVGVRVYYAFSAPLNNPSGRNSIVDIWAICCNQGYSLYQPITLHTLNVRLCNQCQQALELGSNSASYSRIGIVRVNVYEGIYSCQRGGINSNRCKVSIVGVNDNSIIANIGPFGAVAQTAQGETYVDRLKITDTSIGFLYSQGANVLVAKNVLTTNVTTLVSSVADLGVSNFYFHSLDRVANNHRIINQLGAIVSATDQRQTASGISWKLQPTSSLAASNHSLALSLAKVACAANSLVTVKAWMRRDNSGLTMRLACKGGQIAGVANDVTASVTTTNAWEEETITFTPTEAGVVEIIAEAWGGTTFSGWVDDMTISQA